MDTENQDQAPAPRHNPDLLGQDEAANTLADGFASGKLAHAWMLSGPKGIGKATLAYRFARHVLAAPSEHAASAGLFGAEEMPVQRSDGADPLYMAPEHPIFQRVAASGHADLMTVERTLGTTGKLRSEIVVNDVREVIRFLNLTAGEGGWRTVIVDSADELNPNAANALLKVLEEPPPKAMIMLVCHNPGRLLPTIRSRCRKLRLAELSTDTLDTLLQRYMPDIPERERQELAALSDGSIGRALSLARADGAELQNRIMSFLAQAPSLDIAELQQFGATLTKADAQPRFDTTADLLRRALARLIRHAGGAANDPKLASSSTETETLARLAQAGGLDRWLQVWEKTDNLLRMTNRINLDRKQVILNIFLTISQAVRG